MQYDTPRDVRLTQLGLASKIRQVEPASVGGTDMDDAAHANCVRRDIAGVGDRSAVREELMVESHPVGID
jgi:hypothetical protein